MVYGIFSREEGDLGFEEIILGVCTDLSSAERFIARECGGDARWERQPHGHVAGEAERWLVAAASAEYVVSGFTPFVA